MRHPCPKLRASGSTPRLRRGVAPAPKHTGSYDHDEDFRRLTPRSGTRVEDGASPPPAPSAERPSAVRTSASRAARSTARFAVSIVRVDGLDHAPGGVSEVPSPPTAGHFEWHCCHSIRCSGPAHSCGGCRPTWLRLKCSSRDQRRSHGLRRAGDLREGWRCLARLLAGGLQARQSVAMETGERAGSCRSSGSTLLEDIGVRRGDRAPAKRRWLPDGFVIYGPGASYSSVWGW